MKKIIVQVVYVMVGLSLIKMILSLLLIKNLEYMMKIRL